MQRRITPSYTKNPSKPNTTPLETVSLFSSQSRLQLNFNTSVYLQAFRRNICSSRLADPGIFAVSVRARKPIRSSDVSGLCYIITGGGEGEEGRGRNVYNRNGGFNFTRLSRVLQTNCTSKWAPFSLLSAAGYTWTKDLYLSGDHPLLDTFQRVDRWFVNNASYFLFRF